VPVEARAGATHGQRGRRGTVGSEAPRTLRRGPEEEEEDDAVADRALRIALVAHDAKKEALVGWARAWSGALARHRLCGTGTSAGEVMDACPGLRVEELLSGPKGGDLQVGARIAARELDALVFFPDPESPHPHENDVQALIRISLLADIPVALNRASADHLAEAMFAVRGKG
jgi:methylglyoxal synthase